MPNYSVAHIDDIPKLEAGEDCPIQPVRHHFGITSFGINAWTAADAGDRIINEHVEDGLGSTEELYLVTKGRAVFELDGERREVDTGTFVSVPAEVKRTAFAEEAGTTVVAIGATRGQAYNPVGWELWYPLRKSYEAGNHAEVKARLKQVVADNAGYGLLYFNLACLESLTGEKADAIEHLRQALELSDQWREFAKADTDLDAIRDDPAVQELLAG